MKLLAKDIDRVALIELTAAPEWKASEALLWVECPGCAELVPCDDGRATELIRRSISGRIFSPKGELRWRALRVERHEGREAAVFLDRAVFFGPEPPETLVRVLSDRSEEIKALERDETMETVALWGRLDKTTLGTPHPIWAERNIPRRFAYPWRSDGPPPERLGLEREVWRGPAGELAFARFVRLVPAPHARH